MKPPFLRTPYNYDMNEVSEQTSLACKDKTLTQQSFKEEADINTIVERFHLTGQLPQFNQLPQYADYEGIFDFQDAMNVIREAQETFMELPANLRARFHNNPQEFLEFCGDPENLPEAKKLGILSPEALQRLEQPKGDSTNGTNHQQGTASAPAQNAQVQPGGTGAQGAQAQAPQPQKPG